MSNRSGIWKGMLRTCHVLCVDELLGFCLGDAGNQSYTIIPLLQQHPEVFPNHHHPSCISIEPFDSMVMRKLYRISKIVIKLIKPCNAHVCINEKNMMVLSLNFTEKVRVISKKFLPFLFLMKTWWMFWLKMCNRRLYKNNLSKIVVS